jgi:LPS O-antigen subunit length determinant protein (WzzB/FepE family)
MERRTYVELMANRGVFSNFVKEFGSWQQQEDETDETKDGVEVKEKNKKRPDAADLKEESKRARRSCKRRKGTSALSPGKHARSTLLPGMDTS